MYQMTKYWKVFPRMFKCIRTLRIVPRREARITRETIMRIIVPGGPAPDWHTIHDTGRETGEVINIPTLQHRQHSPHSRQPHQTGLANFELSDEVWWSECLQSRHPSTPWCRTPPGPSYACGPGGWPFRQSDVRIWTPSNKVKITLLQV